MIRDWIGQMRQPAPPGSGEPLPEAARSEETRSVEVALIGPLRSTETSPARAREVVERVVDSTSGALLLVASLDRGEIPSSLRDEIVEHAAARSGLNTRGLFARFLPPSQRQEELGNVIKPEPILDRQGDVSRGRTLFLENDPVPGSFSDFVWVFDRDSGDVLSASFSGAFAYVLDWGFAKTEVHARVSARMGTTDVAGFEPLTRVWGRSLYPYCEDVRAQGCTAVQPRAYDERGYVNAVGYLAIDSPITQFATYSALGEARFSEIASDVPVTPPVAAGSAVAIPVSWGSSGPGSAAPASAVPAP